MGGTVGLPLEIEKVFNGRLLVTKALEDWSGRLHAESCGHVFDALWAALTLRTDDELGSPREGESLTSFLEGLARSVCASTAGVAEANSVVGVKGAIERNVESFVKSPSDSARSLFQVVYEASLCFYGACGIELPPATAGTVAFDLAFNARKPAHSFDVPIHLGGNARTTATGVTVRLVVVASKIDWRSWLAAPYTLFHEIVVHACDSRPGGGDVEEVPERESFSEGWMDYVAAAVHRAVMDGQAPVAEFRKQFPDSKGHGRMGNELHEARFVKGLDGRAFGSRLVGRETAERVCALLEDLEETRGDPQLAFWRMSAALNTCAVPASERDEVVGILHKALDPQFLSGREAGQPVRRFAERLDAAKGTADRLRAAEDFAAAVLRLKG